MKSICSGDLFKGLLDLPINYDPSAGSKICAGSEITDLCRKTEISLTKGFSEGIQREGDPRVGVNAEQGLVGILEINPIQFGGMLAGHGPVSNHVPGITGCFRQAGDGQTRGTDRYLGGASFSVRYKHPIDEIKRRWIELVGDDVPQGSEITGLYFGAPRIQPMSFGSVARAVSTADDIRQIESVTCRLGKFVLSVVEFFGQSLFFLFIGLETGLADGAVIPFVPCEDRTHPEVFLL